MIAMTLAAEPDFLIADEPTTALDVTIQAQMLDLLKRTAGEQGMGLLLITHDLAVVAGMAHRVALMYAGQIIEVAKARRVLRRAEASVRAAAAARAARRRKRGEPLAAIPGTVPPLTQQFAGCRFRRAATRVAHAECVAAPPPLFEPASKPSACAVFCISRCDAGCPPRARAGLTGDAG